MKPVLPHTSIQSHFLYLLKNTHDKTAKEINVICGIVESAVKSQLAFGDPESFSRQVTSRDGLLLLTSIS